MNHARMKLSSLKKSHRWLILTVLGLVGFVLGFLSQIVGGIGFQLLLAGALLWCTAWFGRKEVQWSSEVRCYGDILIVFGGMATIGFEIRFLMEMAL